MSFDQIRGHQKILDLLSRVIRNKKIAHAYIFSGLEGIGKRLTALALAKNLLCVAGSGESCGKCSACMHIDQGNHPDVMMIEPEKGVIVIDNIRNLKRELSRKSFSGGYKVCVIDEAEKMNVQASNALLKTLEEPTPDTVIILITEKPYHLLPTVLSRCQHLKFQPLSFSDASELIREKSGANEADALLMASFTGGSPGKALALTGEDFKGVRDLWIRQLMSSATVEGEMIFDGKKNYVSDKERLDLKLNLLRLWYRDLLLHKIYGSSAFFSNKDKIEDIAAHGKAFSLEKLLTALFEIEKYTQALEYNANPQLTLDALFMRLNFKSGNVSLA